jgi:hypothetical protein
MPLENFGSILNFAEQMEKQDQEFFSAAAVNAASPVRCSYRLGMSPMK